ncbi:MAG: proprotein convertase P-domain-containing protein, partial [Saprospiraceae bacterium]|nr:proprotein convertase P-domain-containing protein [Saprospiraceae bacterium]
VSPITVPCNFPLDPKVSQNTTLSLKFPAEGLAGNNTLLDFQTKQYTFPVTVPQGMVVNDVDFVAKITGDAFFNNIQIFLESPSGTIVTLWNKLGGCAPAPIWARFDDEGSGVFDCPTYTTGINAQIPLGFGVLSSFDGEPAKGTWKLRILDVDGSGDVSTIEIADLIINMSGVITTGFPNGLVPLNNSNVFMTPNPNVFNVPVGLDPCGPATLSYFDQPSTQTCASIYTKIITRHWTATDQSGNTATCDQIINVLRPTLFDITPPPDYDGIDGPAFTCNDPYPTPDWIVSQGLQGYPWAFGMPGVCNLNVGFVDTKLPICDGSYDVLREWTVIDPCISWGSMQYQQIIHVRDDVAPEFVDCPVDMIETTDPYTCCATFQFPAIIVQDPGDCSRINNVYALVKAEDPATGLLTTLYHVNGFLNNFPGNNPNFSDTLATFANMTCVPTGHYTVCYYAEDDCGNIGTCSFELWVSDYAPPQPSCDETTIVSIGVDDPNDCYFPNPNGCEFAGITWVKAMTFDDGSYDQCSPIKFTIRRAAPYSDCIQSLDHGFCPGNANGMSEFDLATAESDSIKFYCCEVGTTLQVILRVYQLEPDGVTISLYPDGTPIYNECTVDVTVQDKLKPVCQPPFNVTVSCETFDPSLWVYGKATAFDNCCLDASMEYQGQKGMTHSVNYTQFDSVCNKGTIIRTFRVFDCHGQSSQCTQRIVVNYDQDYYIKFPNDVIVTVCDGSGVYGEPTFFGEDCELLGVTYEDQVFTVVPDACYKIERTWKIINWCTYDPNLGCINVPNPNPNAITNHASNLPGPVVSPIQTSGDPWKSTIVKVKSTDQSATNYSIYWDANANCYTYKQIIKVIDTHAPIIDCPSDTLEFCDLSANNAQLWNESYWYDASIQSHDLCEGAVDLSVTSTDLCSGTNLSVRYLLFLDLDGDGNMETVVNSVNPPAPGTVNYNNINTPNFTGGQVRAFDERPVSSTQKYRWALENTTSGTDLISSVRWNTQATPNSYSVPELPYGTHKIKWFVSDGCGNEAVCEYTFIVKDCKGPSVTCINGLSANMGPNGSLIVYASDFLVHAEDNCTPMDLLEFGIRVLGTGNGFPVDGNGNPLISIELTCNDLGTVPVELWGIDVAGNADYCETYIIVTDNLGNCTNDMATVSGLLKTEMGDGLEESDIELSGQHPAGPSFDYFDMTDQSGSFSFIHAVPVFSNYTLMPAKDDNPLNGVTTYDLVLISKHILGIEPLGSPYKMIAADANKSNSITTFDIVELRKLILGIYQDLPDNTSWRFVDKSFQFANPANPFAAAFPESKTVADVQANAMDEDFVAIKIGDVNNTVVANSLMKSDDRSSGTLVFDVNDKTVKAGEYFELNFKASENVAGYQFTLNYPDLELVDIGTNDDVKVDNFAIFSDENALTTSWNGDEQVEFSLKFRARRNGEISKMLSLSSRITKAEAYKTVVEGEAPEKLAIALRFNGEAGTVLTGVGFELYQNQPNPFVNRTSIGFHLPEATTAHLTVYDQSGRLIYSQKGDFPKGYNSILLDKAMVNSTGMLYYTLETDTDSATRKMIQAK